MLLTPIFLFLLSTCICSSCIFSLLITMVATMSTQVELKVPPQKLWEALQQSSELLPKIQPSFFASYEIIEGNGGPGSIRLLKFGPEVPGLTFAKERVEVLDDASKTITYSVIEGEITALYSLYRPTLRVAAGSEENSCIAEWSIEFEAVNETVPPPELAKTGAVGVFKALEAYLVSTN